MRARELPFTIALAVTLTGCASQYHDTGGPKPRPLGSSLETYRAPPEPSKLVVQPAGPEEPTGVISLREALSFALMKNPKLAVFSWEVRAQEARIIQAGLLPNPEIAVEAENFTGSGAFNGFGAAETTFSLGQLIELGGKRELRQRLAAFDRDLAGWDYESQRLAVYGDVAIAFVSILAAQERVELAKDLIRTAEEAVETVARQVRVGAVSPVEATRARVALATAQLDRDKTRHELAAGRQRLAATWGSTAPAFSAVTGDLFGVVAPPSIERLRTKVENNPAIARRVSELEQRKATLALEEVQWIPDVTVGGGLRLIHESADAAVVAEIGIPLPVFDRNQGTILEARHRLAMAQEERRTAEVELHTEVGITYEDLLSAFEETTSLRDKVIPEAQRAFDTAGEAYRRGLFRYLEVLDAQRTLFELRGRLIDALENYHQAAAAMERLIGQPLDTVGDVDARP